MMLTMKTDCFSLAIVLLLGGSIGVSAQCSNVDSGACDFEPYNPVTCGVDNCPYSSFCLAMENGVADPATECCQAPQLSACTLESDPQICGTLECEYANLCLATKAGYSEDQCAPPPVECPESTADCSGEPSNPFKCGPAKNCQYPTICDLRSAGWDDSVDCCQDPRTESACPAILEPVSCGPIHKQCPYSTQCEADAAGYNENQCCKAIPEGTACTQENAPVECGNIPCVFSNQCEASAAGYEETECCPTPDPNTPCILSLEPVQCGVANCAYSNQCAASAAGFEETDCCRVPQDEATPCTLEIAPVKCGSTPQEARCQYDNLCLATSSGYTEEECCPVGEGACTTESDPVLCDFGKCYYDSQSCADLAGFSSTQCCNQPAVGTSCSMEYAPLACSSADCVYSNDCVAELAGFDPASCVPVPTDSVPQTPAPSTAAPVLPPSVAPTVCKGSKCGKQKDDDGIGPTSLESSNAARSSKLKGVSSFVPLVVGLQVVL